MNLAAGGMKLARPKAALARLGQGWVDDFAAPAVKLIGTAEVLGALGLVLPLATGIAPILTPIAAIGIAVLQSGAIATHARRNEPWIVNIVIVALAIVSAVLGFLVVLG
ncbi:DoxX family protein [Microbacterium ulmi]